MNSKIDARVKSMEMAIDIVDRFRSIQFDDINVLCSIASTIEEYMTNGINMPGVVFNGQPTQLIVNNSQQQQNDENEESECAVCGYMALYKDVDSVWGSEVYSTYDEAEQNACRYAGFIGVTKISI